VILAVRRKTSHPTGLAIFCSASTDEAKRTHKPDISSQINNTISAHQRTPGCRYRGSVVFSLFAGVFVRTTLLIQACVFLIGNHRPGFRLENPSAVYFRSHFEGFRLIGSLELRQVVIATQGGQQIENLDLASDESIE